MIWKKSLCFKVKIHVAPNLDSPGEACHGVLVERVADGEVALHGEGKDGEDRGVARHLGDQRPGFARHFTQGPWVLLPVDGLHIENVISVQLIGLNKNI